MLPTAPASRGVPASPVVHVAFLSAYASYAQPTFPAHAPSRALGIEQISYLRFERGEVEPNLTIIATRASSLGLRPTIPLRICQSCQQPSPSSNTGLNVTLARGVRASLLLAERTREHDQSGVIPTGLSGNDC